MGKCPLGWGESSKPGSVRQQWTRESLAVDRPVYEIVSLEKQQPGVLRGWKSWCSSQEPGEGGLEMDTPMGCQPAGAWRWACWGCGDQKTGGSCRGDRSGQPPGGRSAMVGGTAWCSRPWLFGVKSDTKKPHLGGRVLWVESSVCKGDTLRGFLSCS